MPDAERETRIFISRAGADAEIAQWIAQELRALGFQTLLQDENFKPGESIAGNMLAGGECLRTIALFSPDYFQSKYTHPEWEAAFMADPKGEHGTLVPIRVKDCHVPNLLSRLACIDFLGRNDDERRFMLSRGLGRPVPIKSVFVAKLPAVSPILIGRETEIQRLDAAWIDPNVRVMSIVAFGGVGKSALAINWWHRNKAAGAARVLGWSFYSQGAAEDRQASAEPFLDYALRVWFDKEPPKDSWERGERLAECIRRDSTLLILDGLEPIQHPPGPMDGRLKDPGMVALLRNLAAHNPGLCVCTSRLPLTDLEDFAGTGAEQISLENLTPEAGAAYLRALKVEGPEEELRAASEDFDGHALALTLLGGYLKAAFDGDIRKRDTIPSLFGERKKGGHARRIMRQYEKLFQGKPELAVLWMLGLFDRPADGGAVARLRKLPYFAMSETAWRFALENLHEARLIYEVAKDGTMDCHPLIREHFAAEAERSHPDVFKEAHSWLYEHYSVQAPHRPDTLAEMTPLFYAVYHGCMAGRHQGTRDDVYRDRIHRGKEFYLIRRLGAVGVDLSLLANFFESPWEKPVFGLTPLGQSWVSNSAAFALRALGRLAEAVEPMRLGAEAALDLHHWVNAALGFGNLSELQLALGTIPDAIASARRSVELADRSDSAFHRVVNRTTLADALHQSGELALAAQLFAGAEMMQREIAPGYPLLYSARGYHYCDLLLDQGQPAEVLRRVNETIGISKRNDLLLDVALDRLLLGRGYPPASSGATNYLEKAVKGLRIAGVLDFVPLGRLARAANFRHLGDFVHAQGDLDEVRDLASRCGMRLHLTDYHLEQARLYLAQPATDTQTPADRARPHVDAAATLIAETGYHRRDAELADLEKRIA
jgi:tetratricopeptide (TPR) repeat protein